MAKRKKNKVMPKRDMVTELDNWKSGDNCYTLFGGETKPSYCEIIEFIPNDDLAPAVSVIELQTGRYRTAAMMAIAETSKEAKKLGPVWREFLQDIQAKRMKLERAQRRARLEAEQKLIAEQNRAQAAAELEAAEAETRELKKQKNKK